ncbi:MAG: phosphodiester glycosidase family protein [Cyanobacteria bacterium J06576_12]
MKKQLQRALKIGLGTLGVLGLGLGGFYGHRMTLRPGRTPEERSLYQGVTYQRHIYTQPRRLVLHTVEVDLTAPGLDFFVTPSVPTDGYKLSADTVPGFLSQYGTQVAINGSYFAPHEVDSPLHYYPHVGNGVRSLGIAISDGNQYSAAKPGWAALCIVSLNDIRITKNDCPVGTEEAIAGDVQFVKNGKPYNGLAILKNSTKLYPRSAIALNADNTKLWFIAIDGRQPGYSEGVTLAELADILVRDLGVDRALNFDGGGSTTLATSDSAGQPILLNAPFQARVPMNLRPVSNHLGLYAQPLNQASNEP